MTEYFLGRRTQFNYAIEDVAYGTPNTADTFAWLGQVQKFTPDDKLDIRELDAMDDTDTRNPTTHDVLVKRYGGTLAFLPQHMRHLILPLGPDTFGAGAGPTYEHTIVPGNTLPSFGFEVGFQHTTDFGIRYDGAVAKTYEIGSTKGDWVRCTMGIVAKTGTKITSYKSYQAASLALKQYTKAQLRPFRHSDITLTINSIEYQVALNTWRLSLDNQVVAEPHDDDTISEPIPGLRKWSASFDVNMASSALWDLKEAAVATTISVEIAKSAADKVVLTLDNPTIESLNPPFDVTAGLVNVTLPVVCTSITPVITDAIDVDYDTVCA